MYYVLTSDALVCLWNQSASSPSETPHVVEVIRDFVNAALSSMQQPRLTYQYQQPRH